MVAHGNPCLKAVGPGDLTAGHHATEEGRSTDGGCFRDVTHCGGDILDKTSCELRDGDCLAILPAGRAGEHKARSCYLLLKGRSTYGGCFRESPTMGETF